MYSFPPFLVLQPPTRFFPGFLFTLAILPRSISVVPTPLPTPGHARILFGPNFPDHFALISRLFNRVPPTKNPFSRCKVDLFCSVDFIAWSVHSSPLCLNLQDLAHSHIPCPNKLYPYSARFKPFFPPGALAFFCALGLLAFLTPIRIPPVCR